jgi:hypothetical protein
MKRKLNIASIPQIHPGNTLHRPYRLLMHQDNITQVKSRKDDAMQCTKTEALSSTNADNSLAFPSEKLDHARN